MTIRPAWLLAALIMLGWIIGAAGDLYNVCPSFPQGLPCPESATFYLAQFNLLVVNYHQYYQLFSSNFVTDSLADAAFNAVAVLILDRISDSSQFNMTRYLSIFFITALLGNILSLLAGPYYVSAGASGGVFGLYAAIFSFSWAEEKKIDKATLGLFLIIFVASSLLGGVNWIAHVGGAIGGFIAGPLLYKMLAERLQAYSQTTDSSFRMKIIVAAIVVTITVATIWQFFVFVTG